LGQLLGALFFGWIAEKYGRMIGMIWSIGTWAIMSFACAFAWNYKSFLAFQLIQGFGLGRELLVAAVQSDGRAQGHDGADLLHH
jgi:putative MFS transporter